MTSTTAPSIKTLADLMKRLGGVPLDRVRFHPNPGTATIQDVIDLEQKEDVRCELVEGVLVEKVTGYTESQLALFLGGLLTAFVIPRNLGIVTGPDGTMEIMADLVRIPDVAFTSWDRFPGRRRPAASVPRLAPNLAVEVLSRGNTPGEMAVKCQDYFAAGVQMIWLIDPVARRVEVHTSATQVTTLGMADMLDAGAVLTGFTLAVQELFAELDRQG